MYCPFELPDDEYRDLKFERRLAMEDSLSPVTSRTSRAADSRRGSTVADTDGRFHTVQCISQSMSNKITLNLSQNHGLPLSRLEVASPI
jgi:hypothetical protein